MENLKWILLMEQAHGGDRQASHIAIGQTGSMQLSEWAWMKFLDNLKGSCPCILSKAYFNIFINKNPFVKFTHTNPWTSWLTSLHKIYKILWWNISQEWINKLLYNQLLGLFIYPTWGQTIIFLLVKMCCYFLCYTGIFWPHSCWVLQQYSIRVLQTAYIFMSMNIYHV